MKANPDFISITNSTLFLCDAAYNIMSSQDGRMVVSVAKIGSSFQPITINTERPLNRQHFYCVTTEDGNVLMVGGDGIGITSTEIWRFDIFKRQWKLLTTTQKPIKRRTFHVCAAYKNIVYVYGGNHELEFANSLLVITLNNDTYEYKEIGRQSDWPCPRRLSSMTLYKNTIYMFGGITQVDYKKPKDGTLSYDDDELLSDLWMLDFSLFPQCPSWHLVENRHTPTPRYGHISYFNENSFYVAGGIGSKRQWVNDVWKYSSDSEHSSLQQNKEGDFKWWEQVMIFETPYPIMISPSGILEISSTLKIISQKPPFAALDDLFDSLHRKQYEYTIKSKIDQEQFTSLDFEIRKIRDYTRAAQSGDRNHPDFIEMTKTFSNENAKLMKKHINEIRNKLTQTIVQILQEYPKFIVSTDPFLNAKMNNLALEINLKLQQIQNKFKRLKSERENEITLYRQHLQFLKPNTNAKYPEIDPGDFETFDLYSNSLSKAQQEFALQQYYRIQLREYQNLIEQTQNAKQFAQKNKELLDRNSKIVSRLTDQLTKNFKKTNQNEEDLKTWKAKLTDTVEDYQKATEFLNAYEQSTTNNVALQRKITDLTQKNDEMLRSLRADYDLVIQNQPIFVSMYKMTNDLTEEIRNKTSEEIVQLKLIDMYFPKLQAQYEALISSMKKRKLNK